jgi:hypothetical protein
VAHTLTWQVPTTYTDCSALDPLRDIREYDIYACDNILFLDSLLPCATVAGIDNTGWPVSFFDLWLLAPFGIQPPVYISMKAVSTDNVESAFATWIKWEE